MTIAERIKSKVDCLAPPQQEALLALLQTIPAPKPVRPRAKRKRSREAEIDAALRGIAGIWKDRTDLPKDPVQAVKVLRSRMRSRRPHA